MDKHYYPASVFRQILIAVFFAFNLGLASQSFAYNVDADRSEPNSESYSCDWETKTVAPPVINSVSFTSPTDCGVNDGTITVHASSTLAMEYSINFGTNWQVDSNFINLPAASYTILVRNIGEMTDVAYMSNPVVLVAPRAPTIFGVTQTPPTNCVNSDGIISVGALPGDGSPQYSIDGGQNWFASGSFPNLPSGVYQVYARNSNGSCVSPYTNNPVELFSAQSPDIQSVMVSPASDCGVFDGQIVIVGNGSAALQYSIDGGANWRSINTFDNLAPGDYNVAIQYADGTCQVTYGLNPVNVGGVLPAEFDDAIAVDISDCGANDGSIDIIATPGVGSVEYSIDDGATWSPDSSFTNLGPNSYNLKIRYLDQSCELDYRSNPIVFSDPTPPFIIAVDSIDPTGCGIDNGEINILATGTRELFYSIDGGNNYQSNNIFSNLAAGTYNLVVAYAGRACTDTYPNVSLANDGSSNVSIALTDADACIMANGAYPLSATNISVNGGSLNTAYSVNYSSTDGTFDDPTDANTNFHPTSNTAGAYTITVTITDIATNCTDQKNMNFTLLASPTTNMSPDSVCSGGATTLSSGAVGLHQWSVVSGDFSSLSCTTCAAPIATPDETTVYRVSVRNGFINNCETIDFVEIYVYDPPTVINPVSAYSVCNADVLAISLELSEPIANYLISTFDDYDMVVVNGNLLTMNAILTGLVANYSILFTGANGCQATHVFSVQRTAAPTAAFTFDLPTCEGSEVSLSFSGSAGPNANLTWDLDGGSLLYASPVMGSNPAASEITASWTGLGTYSVTLTVEEGGCTDQISQDVEILNTAPQVSSTVTLASSCGTTLGAIDLTATGANNQFVWEGPNGFTATTEDINGLIAGFYALTVTDMVTLCSTVATISVDEDGLFNCTDYIRILIPAINPYAICLDDVVNLPGAITSASVCGDNPATVTVMVNQTTDCLTLDPNDAFVGEDTVCVVHCDSNSPQNCDTTYIVVMVSPPTDTISVNILADIQSEICIDASVLQISGTISSSAFCGVGNAATVQGLSVNDECVIVRAAQGFTGLSPDLICVINCYDNFALFCDTTYIEITVDPNNCNDLIAEENLTVSLTDCNAPTDICLSIPFSTLGTYTLRDNGATYGGSYTQCGTDSTQIQLTQGTHLLVFRETATGCPDTVIVAVDNGLDLYSGATDFEVACDSILTICLDIPFADAADYQITDNGNPLTTAGCGLDSFYVYDYSQIPGQGGTGPYLLQNWTVNGSVFIGSFNSIPELVDSMNSWNPSGNWMDDPATLSIVGGDFNATYSATIQVTQVLGGSGTITLGVGYQPSNVSIELAVGIHQVVMSYLPTNCFESITFDIHCVIDPLCPDVLVGPVNLNATDCASLAVFCTEISSVDFVNYNVYDNGSAYAGNFSGCNNVEILNYSFAALPGQGNAGPYTLASWSVGLDIFSGLVFNDLSELAAEMNTWDPTGNWTVNGQQIEGGMPNSGYGTIQVVFNSATFPVYATPQIIASSVGVELDTGYHQLVLEYIPNGCLDTVEVNVNCVDCVDFILVESTTMTISDCSADAAFCVAIPFASIGNYTITDNNFPYTKGTSDCPGAAGLATQLNLSQGVHQLVFTETATGCSDAVEVIINCVSSSIQEIEILVNTTDTLCADNTELLGAIISVSNDCEDASGETAVFTAIPGTYCYEINAVEVGSDTACIILCDATLCDTSYLIVTVVEEITPGDLPIAEADAATTLSGQPLSYDVIANDLINGTLDTFYILNQPDNGFAWYDSVGYIHYQPDAEFCDFANPEMIAYTICNENGCDTTELLITVICDDLKAFSGFSPNGDGKNDAFVIQGAEAYPNSQLFIFSRWGTLIFKVAGYQNDWDGTWQGSALPEGTYFYMFDSGEGETKSGYLQINR